MKRVFLSLAYCVTFLVFNGFASYVFPNADADALPRGLIVQIGGAEPAEGEGRIIHYSEYAPLSLPYAENTVRRLVSEEPISEQEVLRVLRPLGTARIKTANGWIDLTKPWPNDIDEWTHWLHGPGSNPVAADQRVGIPRRLLWTATPRRSRSHEKSPSLTGMVSARGRLFYICDEAPVSVGGEIPDRWTLTARDAFSGTLLWKNEMPDWGWRSWSPTEPMNLRWGNPRFIHRRLVAVGDYVYVTLGYSAPVSVLDAETGEIVRVLSGTENTAEILMHEDILILSVTASEEKTVNSAPLMKLMTVDPKTDEILWETETMESQADFDARGKSATLKQGRLLIAADNDFVVAATPTEVICFELNTGMIRWRASAECKNQLGSLVAYRGNVYYGPISRSGETIILCLDGESGTERWNAKGADWTYSTSANFYLVNDHFIIGAPGKNRGSKAELLFLNATTGEEVRRIDISAINSAHHHRCYRNKATENFLLMGKEGIECVDFRTGKVSVNRWVRGACLYGIMPANGLIYFSPEACACNMMNRLDGFGALAPAAPPQEPAHPFLEGSAFTRSIQEDSIHTLSSAWPQYRRNALRCNSTSTSPSLEDGWRISLGGRLTAPTSDNARLYLGRDDETLALSCKDGEVVWRTKDRIDSPPSLYRGLAIYGTRDGWVRCRIAETGELAWSFRAAPEERMILDDDHLESVWPLHGSVLIFNDTVYAVAGRSSNLDGGLRLFALSPTTGEVKASSVFFSEQTVQSDYYEGVNNDLLATDGEKIFLKHMRIDANTLAITRQTWWNFSGPDGKLKNYNKDPINLPVENVRTRELSASAGFLDDEIFGRAHMQLDRAELCNRICFNEERSYGIRHSIGAGHFQYYTPGSGGFPVLCFDRSLQFEPPLSGSRAEFPTDPMPHVIGSKLRGTAPIDHGLLWHNKIPLRPTALIAAGEQLILGGGPDYIDPSDPLRSPEWRAGGLLYMLNSKNGEETQILSLSSPPVHEGLLAVPSGLFCCLKDGSVIRIDH
jgi:outer membrane protein assembly factor BamB